MLGCLIKLRDLSNQHFKKIGTPKADSWKMRHIARKRTLLGMAMARSIIWQSHTAGQDRGNIQINYTPP